MASLNNLGVDSQTLASPVSSPSRTLVLAKSWILVSAFLSCSGWLLSALGQLDTVGYVFVLVVGLALWVVLGRKACGRLHWKLPAGKFRWRYTHALPALFLLFACLAALGGMLYAPNNFDGLSYRFPRLLHWIAEHRWHWIATCEGRMNISATGFEWLMAPLFAITHSDRLFFLINLVSYALLPGLTYATFTGLGVSKRQAWAWMWLLPCGYGFVLQAGSIGNDAFAVVYLLASLCFALKFRKTGRASDFWFGMLAAALLIGAKTSNLPLLLPWALASFSGVRLLKTRPLGTGLVAIVCILVSCVPTAWQNNKHLGDWAGDPSSKVKLTNPYYGLLGNGLQLVCQNATPPVMPATKLWNDRAEAWLQSPPQRPLVHYFPRISLKWGEIQQEELAGLGLGLSALLVITLVAGLRSAPAAFRSPDRKLGMLICLGGWVALSVYMAKLGSESAARLVLPYYPLLIASVLLLPAAGGLACRRWWKTLACLAALSALPPLILTPSRPLWPALSTCEKLKQALPGNPLVERMHAVYSIYRNRNDSLAPLRKQLTQDDSVVVFLAGDESEVALWRPFGVRQVVDIPQSGMPPAQLQRPWRMITREEEFSLAFKQTMAQWMQANGGRIIGSEWIATKISRGPVQWLVLQFDAPPQTGKE